jgi:arginine deiminase
MVAVKVNEELFLKEIESLENELNEVVEVAKEEVRNLDVNEETKNKIVELIIGDKSIKCKERLDYLKKFLMEVEVEEPTEPTLAEVPNPKDEEVASERTDVPVGFGEIPKI